MSLFDEILAAWKETVSDIKGIARKTVNVLKPKKSILEEVEQDTPLSGGEIKFTDKWAIQPYWAESEIPKSDPAARFFQTGIWFVWTGLQSIDNLRGDIVAAHYDSQKRTIEKYGSQRWLSTWDIKKLVEANETKKKKYIAPTFISTLSQPLVDIGEWAATPEEKKQKFAGRSFYENIIDPEYYFYEAPSVLGQFAGQIAWAAATWWLAPVSSVITSFAITRDELKKDGLSSGEASLWATPIAALDALALGRFVKPIVKKIASKSTKEIIEDTLLDKTFLEKSFSYAKKIAWGYLTEWSTEWAQQAIQDYATTNDVNARNVAESFFWGWFWGWVFETVLTTPQYVRELEKAWIDVADASKIVTTADKNLSESDKQDVVVSTMKSKEEGAQKLVEKLNENNKQDIANGLQLSFEIPSSETIVFAPVTKKESNKLNEKIKKDTVKDFVSSTEKILTDKVKTAEYILEGNKGELEKFYKRYKD